MNSTPTISAVDFIRRCAETLAEFHFKPGKTYWFCDQYGEMHKFTIPPEPHKANSSPTSSAITTATGRALTKRSPQGGII